MENRVWGDRIKEYEKSNTLNLLEMIEDLKIKNNELEAELAYEKLITESLNKSQNMTCEELGRYVVENHELREICKKYERLINMPLTIDDVRSVVDCHGFSVYINEKVKLTEFYKSSKNDPSDPRD